MSDQNQDDDFAARFVEYVKKYNENVRQHAHFFQGMSKEETEYAVVRAFLEEEGSLADAKQMIVGKGSNETDLPIDPPDVIVRFSSGDLVGYEVTELVKGDAIPAYGKDYGKYVEMTFLSDEDILQLILKRLKAKVDHVDSSLAKKFTQYVVLMHSDEPDLHNLRLRGILSTLEWTKPDHIHEVAIILSYDPGLHCCPVIKIP